MLSNPLGGEALSRAEPPAGPPKTTKSLGEVDFPENSDISGVMKIDENSSFFGVRKKS